MSAAALDGSHDPGLVSWVASANLEGGDFPIQNLPFGRFRVRASHPDGEEPFRIGVAIGDQVLDLRAAAGAGVWSEQVQAWLAPLAAGDLPGFMACGAAARRGLRLQLSAALATGSPAQAALAPCLVAQHAVELSLPCAIGDYTDFYTGIHHATRVGEQFRPQQPLLPNYAWLPIGYHGRSSSIVVSGTPVRRPRGQHRAAGQADDAPQVAPSRRLDYELELGALLGEGNALGEPIAVEQASEHVFGVCLLNDWSARDLQA